LERNTKIAAIVGVTVIGVVSFIYLASRGKLGIKAQSLTKKIDNQPSSNTPSQTPTVTQQ